MVNHEGAKKTCQVDWEGIKVLDIYCESFLQHFSSLEYFYLPKFSTYLQKASGLTQDYHVFTIHGPCIA